MESKNKKTIYISNLPSPISEEDLLSIFASFGVCVSCELNLETLTAYIEFDNEASAEKALAMNNTPMESNLMSVVIAFIDNVVQNVASYTLASKKVDYSQSVQIFVGGIGFDIDEAILREGFSHCGQVLDTKVVRSSDGQHKGFAFVSFSNESDANSAIQKMNNTMFHNRKIQCNWATKNKNTNGASSNPKFNPMKFNKTLEDISYEAPESNTSVYVLGESLTEELLRPIFERFGKIKNVKAFPEKNHAFVNYDTHDAAAYAIQQLNGYKMNNIELKCNWGKKNASQGNVNNQSMVNQFGNQMNPYYDNPQANFYNYQQQYDQYYQAGYQVPQYFNNTQMGSYYNPMPNYQQYQNPYGAQQNFMNANQNNYPAPNQGNFVAQPNLLGQPKGSYGGQPKNNFKAGPKGFPGENKPRMNRATHPYNKPKPNNNQYNTYQQ